MHTHFIIRRLVENDWLMALAAGLLAFALQRLQ